MKSVVRKSSLPLVLCCFTIPALADFKNDTNKEEILNSKIRESLESCITTFNPQSLPWYAFNDALDELDNYGHVLSRFRSAALEDYGVNYPENICFQTNQYIIELLEIIYD